MTNLMNFFTPNFPVKTTRKATKKTFTVTFKALYFLNPKMLLGVKTYTRSVVCFNQSEIVGILENDMYTDVQILKVN